MKVGIVAGLVEGQKTGIGVYTGTLIDALGKLDGGNEFIALNRTNTYYPAVFDWHQYGYYAWQMGVLPIVIRHYKLDIVHDPFGNLACFGLLDIPFKKVITLHDIAPILNKGNFSRLMTTVHGIVTPRAVKRADVIITDSVFSKNEILTTYFIDPDKVKVIHPAVDKRFKPVPTWGKPKQFILYVGSVHKQKNIQALFRAYALIKKDVKNCKVIVVGRKYFDGGTNLPALMQSLDIENDVIFAGYIPDQYLATYYSAASVFVFPSLYEGFGLPPLEAMACGCPVVSSNRASLPEAVGDAALVVDPDNIKAMAEAIRRLIKDRNLKQEMVRRGFERVKKFTPEETARKTLKVYEEVLR
jgi:glycosyltransferase involved in cell wall biosynthesis